MSEATYVNFREIWQNEGRKLSKKPGVFEEVQFLASQWEDILDFNDDEGFPETGLRLVNFAEKVFDCDWLLENFEAGELADLQLAVCRQRFPQESWAQSERYGHVVIASAARSLVCDLLLQDKVSASASLAIGGVQGAPITEEALRYMEARAAQEEAVMEKLRILTEKHRVSQFL